MALTVAAQGARDPDHVLATKEYCRNPDQDATGIRETQIRQATTSGGCFDLQQPHRVPGRFSLVVGKSVSSAATWHGGIQRTVLLTHPQETMNFWKQVSHVLKYWRAEEDPNAKLPTNFVSGFLEVRRRRAFVTRRILTSIGAKLGSRAYLAFCFVHTTEKRCHPFCRRDSYENQIMNVPQRRRYACEHKERPSPCEILLRL